MRCGRFSHGELPSVCRKLQGALSTHHPNGTLTQYKRMVLPPDKPADALSLTRRPDKTLATDGNHVNSIL